MRSYLRDLDANISQWFTPIVKWLIYLCTITFLLEILGGPAVAGWIFTNLGASADKAIYHGWVWQFVTYMFVHANFAHILFNLFTLWMFGTRLEQRWGEDTFLRFIVVVGIGAVATHMVVTILAGSAYLGIPIIGISGLVYGILLVYAYYWPDDLIYLWAVVPIKVKYLVLIMGLLTLMSSANMSSSVAHLTHLGGLVFGFIFIKFRGTFERIPIPWMSRRGRYGRRPGRWRDF